ncbi:type II toxin-antitoxin system HigB family toxin [Gemmobacter sp.]|uniref:type II toxin-antitoxin system HigB family toxin n=1 Tax=Gemmobacter sp. TaxID=1898957 RepID=UPI003A598BE1
MRIIARPKLFAFGERFPDAKVQIDVWWAEARRAEWKTPADIKAQYRSASILKGGRVVFNICGALLHKSGDGQGSPFPGQTHPTASVTGMPSAVKPFRTATRTWNSAT